jgi:hypothetical protein
MIELSKLESLTLDLEKMDAFHDCYVKMLAEAWVANDKERIKALRVVLHKEVAFVALEMVKAWKEEHGTNEIVQ